MKKISHLLLFCILFLMNISCHKNIQNYILDKNTKDTIASFILKEDMGYLIISNQLNFDDKSQIKNVAKLLKVQEFYTEKDEWGTKIFCKVHRYEGSFTNFNLYKEKYSPYDYEYFISTINNTPYEFIYDKWDRRKNAIQLEKATNKLLKRGY